MLQLTLSPSRDGIANLVRAKSLHPKSPKAGGCPFFDYEGILSHILE